MADPVARFVPVVAPFHRQPRLRTWREIAHRYAERDVELARRRVTVNFANTVLFCEHARKRLLARGGGRLTVRKIGF